MKRVFLLIVIPALLVAMGFAQTPTASGNTDQINVKGCVAGSDGNYTVAENTTGKIFKITTSSTDLKAYVGQDVNLTGRPGTAENSLAITGLNMISEHCATTAAAPAAAVSAPAETPSANPAAETAPAAASPDTAVSAPAENVTPPAAAATPPIAPSATVSTPAAATAAPAAAPAMTMPMETASVPAAAAAVHHVRPSPQPREKAAIPAATAAPAVPVTTPVADNVVPSAASGTPTQTADVPPVPAAPAKKTSTGRSVETLLIIIALLVLVGAGVPLYNRWRRRKLAEQTGRENLSFTNEKKSEPVEIATPGGRKAA